MKVTKRLSTRFILQVLVILLIGQSAIFYWTFSNNSTLLERQLRQRVFLTATLISNTAAVAIVSYDYTDIEPLIDQIHTDEDIETVDIFDKDGTSVIAKAHPGWEKESLSALEIPIKAGTEVIGKLIIRYSLKNIKKEITFHLITSLIFQSLIFIVLSVLIYVFFQRNVGKRVANLSERIEVVTGGDLTVDVTALHDDEVGAIANGLGYLVNQIESAIKKIKNISGEVSSAANQLNTTFKGVADIADKQQKSTEDVSGVITNASALQKQIVSNTEKLLSLSNDNLSAILETSATSQQIAVSADNLNQNLNNSYTAVSELAQTAQGVASMSEAVSSAVEQASTSVEEITATVREVENIIKEAASLSTQTTNIISSKGAESVSNAIASINTIKEFAMSLVAIMNDLAKRSGDVEKILAVIKNVTEETSLLSLNAAILAAHAGEYGKGFSVVADEMRHLSDKTAGSTREIAEIILAIQKEIKKAVEGTKETLKTVENGKEVIHKTGGTLNEILFASRNSTEMAKSIERAAVEQTKGLELIVNSIEHIKKMIVDVNKASEEQEKSANYLLESISSIRDAMETTKKATDEQARSSRVITENIELANEKTSEIAKASSEQEKANEKTLALMNDVMKMGKEMTDDVKNVSAFLTALYDKVAVLGKEMEYFKTKD
ncbi:MAG: hypothetical protein HY806_06160 [Nitrospirae bacterium]|nr:hypothetical protein [Nitrospirota bacterium]